MQYSPWSLSSSLTPPTHQLAYWPGRSKAHHQLWLTHGSTHSFMPSSCVLWMARAKPYLTQALGSVAAWIYKSTPLVKVKNSTFPSLFIFSFIFISWRLITLQYCSGFCHTLTWISHGFTCIPHPDPPSHLPLYPIPLGLPSAPGPSTCLMHPTWAGDLFHHR